MNRIRPSTVKTVLAVVQDLWKLMGSHVGNLYWARNRDRNKRVRKRLMEFEAVLLSVTHEAEKALRDIKKLKGGKKP